MQELDSEWEHQQGEEQVLRNQLKRLQDDLRRVNRHLERGQGEKAILEEKIGMSRPMNPYVYAWTSVGDGYVAVNPYV